MPTYFSQGVVDEINELLMTPPSKQSIITTWKTIMQRFRDEGVVKKEKNILHSRYILCHPKNRAGFMLNGFNAHANGSKVKRIGANREELHGAVVIELSPFTAVKKMQIDANIKIAAASNRMIPAPTGEELYMSIGTGHMVCFCRAANAGCSTPFKNIQNDEGVISSESLKKDAEFKVMLEVGWPFDILPWQVEVTWPTLPEFG